MDKFGDELSVRCWVVDAMFPTLIFEDRCVDLCRSMCRLSKIDVLEIDVLTIED